jgi:hypothetical protein
VTGKDAVSIQMISHVKGKISPKIIPNGLGWLIVSIQMISHVKGKSYLMLRPVATKKQ